ncbi:MAG: sulfotransferase, partial [Puniceicoccaceae bacterium]
IHWLGFLLDELIFRSYREVEIKEPLFVIGVPRSGTTFVHRAISADREQFTTMETWEALIAPSITGRKLVRLLSRLDRKVGSPLHRLMDALTARVTGGFSHIHEVGLHAPEEDYLSLLPAGGCFILVLALPASRSLWQLGRFQELPDEQREILVNFYKRCLQKHLYCAPPGRRLLSKNAAFGSWLPDLRFAFPDARYLFCIREPRSSLASQLSSIRSGLKFFATTRAADTYSLEFQTVFAHIYRILLDEKQSFLVDRLAIIDQTRLREDTAAVLEQSLRQVCVPPSNALRKAIAEAAKESGETESTHQHSPLTAKTGPDEFNSLVRHIYEEILAHPCMTRDDFKRPKKRS